MVISIIIPTYNRAHLIEITITSLLRQDYPESLFEILIVDNNSTDKTAEIIKCWSEKTGGRVRYFHEPRQGSHFARNGVVNYAKGEVLYFTDDDMIANPGMLTALVKVLKENQEVGSVTGRVLPKWEKEPPKWVKKFCTNGWLSLYDREDELFISENDFGIFSCHQAVRKDLFIRAGGYNPDIVNGEWLGDNETGLNIKLKALGVKFAFTNKALTYHIIPPARMTQKYLDKRFANQGNCDSYTDYRKSLYSNEQFVHLNKQYKRAKYYRALKALFCFVIWKDKWHVHKAYIYYYATRIKYNKRLMVDDNWRNMVLINDWIHI